MPTAFHAFTTRFPRVVDRMITRVAISSAFDPQHPPDPLPKHHEVDALWDTGATNSVITASTAAALGLPVMGIQTVAHAGGTSPANTYVVNIALPNGVGFAGQPVSECPDTAGQFGAIIGMDIITAGDLSISNVAGQTWMTFRIPSVNRVDFVDEANRFTRAHTGRNDPCPCGSGQKYKKCHGR